MKSIELIINLLTCLKYSKCLLKHLPQFIYTSSEFYLKNNLMFTSSNFRVAFFIYAGENEYYIIHLICVFRNIMLVSLRIGRCIS